MQALPTDQKCDVNRDTDPYSTIGVRSADECTSACVNGEVCTFASYGESEQKCRLYSKPSCDIVSRSSGPVFYLKPSSIGSTLQSDYTSIPNTYCGNTPLKKLTNSSVDNCRAACDTDLNCRYYQFNGNNNECNTFQSCEENTNNDKIYSLLKLSDSKYVQKLSSTNYFAHSALDFASRELQSTSDKLVATSQYVSQLSSDISALTSTLSERQSLDTKLNSLQSSINTMDEQLTAAEALNVERQALIKQKDEIINDVTLTAEQREEALNETVALIEQNNEKIKQSTESISNTQKTIDAKTKELEAVKTELEATKEDVGIIPAILNFLDQIGEVFGIDFR
jgi:predicted  nucleic acid-binding Zn-ribbon protein